MPTYVKRVYRLTVPMGRSFNYSLEALWPEFSGSPCYAEMADENGNLVRIESTVSDSPVVNMQNRLALAVATFANGTAINLTVTLKVPSDAKSLAGWAEFKIEPDVFRDREFVDGYPARCYETEPPPPISPASHQIGSPREWILHAEVVNGLYFSIDYAKLLVGSYSQGYEMVGLPATNEIGTGVLVLKHPARYMVWMIGTTSFGQVVSQALGYLQGVRAIYPPIRTNLEHNIGWQKIFTWMGSVGILRDRPFSLIGHSLGGAIAHNGAVRLHNNFSSPVDVLTFGCPNVGDFNFSNNQSNYPNFNLLNEGDPVPYMPPKLKDVGQYAALLPINKWQDIGIFENIGYAITLGRSGEVTSGFPSLPLVTVLRDMAIAMRDDASIPAYADHELSEYIRRLRLAITVPV